MKRKNILKEAGVLLVAAILVLTAIVIVPMTMAQPLHDVGVSEIISPFCGCLRNYPVNVTVKNYGINSETFDVQFEILKCEAGPQLLYEAFSTWPLTGWTHYGYEESNTDEAGGTPSEAYYGYYSGHYYSNGWIMTPTVVASDCCKIILEFNLTGYFNDYYDSNFYVQWTNDGGVNWHDITPWDNPITNDLEPERYSINITCCCGGFGSAFQVRWYYDNYYYHLQYGSGIYLDDVIIEGYASCAEYAEIVEDVTIPAFGEKAVNFSYWMPSACGEYCVTAFTMLDGDVNSINDCLTKNINIISLESAAEEIKSYILDLTLADFSSPSHIRQTILVNQLNAVISQITTGAPYTGAISILNVIRSKVDGISPPPDWVITPVAQADLCEMIDNLIACLGTI